ncbi:hypothetical protein [Kaistella carnis]|uniref:hypothetical protein n=1 Tax=Kaistella carnis TaxID=1241979 RepID=UPI0028AEE248|nr:hypothetical protein [Kaistella carnis]
MLNLTPEIFEAFQNKLKTGNRRVVHLNAIPGNSRYKLDLAQLSEIHKSLPEHFIVNLLTQKNVSFKFSIHDQIVKEDSADSSRRTLSFEEDKEETQEVENEESPTGAELLKDETKDKNKEKLSRSLENLIFQNEVIYSEKALIPWDLVFPY